MSIKIEKESENRLKRQVWEFNFHYDSWGCKISLLEYSEQERATTRHKFKTNEKRHYEGWRKDRFKMQREDIPLPEEVVAELKNEIYKAINKAISEIGEG